MAAHTGRTRECSAYLPGAATTIGVLAAIFVGAGAHARGAARPGFPLGAGAPMRMHGGANKDGGEDSDGGGSGEVSGALPRPPRVRRHRALPLCPVLGPFAGPGSGRPVCVSQGGTGFAVPASGP